MSMVEAKCRALIAAARWNGQAAQLTTGSASATATQPQFGNWKAGNHRDEEHRDGQDGRDDEPRPQLGGCAAVRHVVLMGRRVLRVLGRYGLVAGTLFLIDVRRSFDPGLVAGGGYLVSRSAGR